MKCPSPRLTRAAITQLQAYHWPGNIRELRNVIQRAVILARGGALQFDLPVTYAAGLSDRPRAKPSLKADVGLNFQTEAEMRERDRENLVAALQYADWKVMGRNGAAELLGVKPTTLFSRMKKYGIKPPAQNSPRM
ncbi:DNA-binding transcriptional activator HyfR [bioreactor metagenome]|uniref:DNA-binding transcriptional activator HyfR n=1 Tax=bioreactor metagenome TaxID=1076179 RepID=A0A645GSE7_9ZZZZ